MVTFNAYRPNQADQCLFEAFDVTVMDAPCPRHRDCCSASGLLQIVCNFSHHAVIHHAVILEPFFFIQNASMYAADLCVTVRPDAFCN
jgi:hypothetical protein